MTQRRILIIRPDRIGDVILTTPLIREVRKKYPDSFIGVMVGSYTEPILRGNPHIDTIITDDPNGKDAGKAGFWQQVKLLRQLRFDTGLMPLPRERHAWMMLLAGIRQRIGVGGKIYQILTGTRTVSRNKYIPLRHEADYVMDLGRKIGVTTQDLTPEIFLTDEEKRTARSFFAKRGFDVTKPVIGINPGSNKSSPNWPPDRYRRLAESLSAQHQIFINAGPPDSGLAKHFTGMNRSVLVYAPNDIREIIALCSQLSVLIAPSTGTMHIAAALKVPTVALFCPLTACSPVLWGPLGNTAEIILPEDDYCQHRCPGDPKICPFDGIEIETVVRQTEKILTTTAATERN
jgi:heptosyltransferase-2